MPDSSSLTHLLGGGVGGTVGAIVTCPLEVVKTRLQSSNTSFHVSTAPPQDVSIRLGYSRIWSSLTQIVLEEGVGGLFRGLGPTLVGVAPARAIYFWAYSSAKQSLNTCTTPDTPSVHILSAASAGLASSCSTNPLWVVKTRLQLENEKASSSVSTIVRTIYKESGVRGFWAGITASAWGISETVVHFVIYEELKKRLEKARGKREGEEGKKTVLDFLGLMGCGAMSKTVATCMAYPHEVARTRLREVGSKYSSFWGTLGMVYREEGRKGLYRGLGTNLVRQIPNTAVMMSTYELVLYLVKRYG